MGFLCILRFSWNGYHTHLDVSRFGYIPNMNGKNQNHSMSLATYGNLSLKSSKIGPYVDNEVLYS